MPDSLPSKLELISAQGVSVDPVFGLGTIVVDHQVMLEALMQDRHQVGGPVPTALCLLRRFGVVTRLHGKWSDDAFGRMVECDLTEEGILFDAEQCRNGARTGFAHVGVEQGTGRRSIAAYRGSHSTQVHEAPLKALAGYKALHLDGWSTPAAVITAQAMKRQGGTVFLDLGSPKPQVEQLLAHVDFLNCPERLLGQLFTNVDIDEGARRLLAMGPREVTITSGSAGARAYTADRMIRHPGFAVEAVDTTGAGDVFAGAMLFGELSGWTAEQKLVFACAAAGLKCRGLGNRDALPRLTDIREFLSCNPPAN
jgi:ribokinase